MIGLLQCTSMYPIPDEDANLNVIRALKAKYLYKIGYSDHTEGSIAATAAVAVGAEILEVHFTDTREGRVFRDHKVSFTPDELVELCSNANRIKSLLGSENKSPTESELQAITQLAFAALYILRDLEKEKLSMHLILQHFGSTYTCK